MMKSLTINKEIATSCISNGNAEIQEQQGSNVIASVAHCNVSDETNSDINIPAVVFT